MPAEPAPYNRLPADARYTRDPLFRTLVDAMYNVIVQGEMTPTEVREAALFAATRYETLHVTPFIAPKKVLTT